jgi:alginate O-acetyltransferase complex protein AlgI
MYFIGRMRSTVESRRRRFLLAQIATAVFFLFILKYGPDIYYGIFSIPLGSVIFPLGLSYFVIRLIDVQLRLHRGELRDVRFREYLCYQLFLPTIPAGPIETIDEFRKKRLDRIRADDIAYGLARILIGLAKKLLVADWIIAGALYDPDKGYYFAAALDPSTATATTSLVYVALTFFYAYVDFSAYSDIAIGASRLFGYRIRENFNWPLLSRNLQDFWRRWHMSLAGWCMRNLYFQMLLVTRSSYLPLLVTMIAIGLWHNFTLGWFLWGLHHACALIFLDWWTSKSRKRRNSQWRDALSRPFSTLFTVYYVSVGYAFVGAHDFPTAVTLYGRAAVAPVEWLLKLNW